MCKSILHDLMTVPTRINLPIVVRGGYPLVASSSRRHKRMFCRQALLFLRVDLARSSAQGRPSLDPRVKSSGMISGLPNSDHRTGSRFIAFVR